MGNIYSLSSLLRSFTATFLGLSISLLATPTIATDNNDFNQENSAPIAIQNLPLADGVYLYGESPEPNQISKTYFIFAVRQGNITGAFYQPSSSFDCVVGDVQSEQLSLNFDRDRPEVQDYAIRLTNNSLLASSEAMAGAEVGLEGLYRLPKISDHDRQVLRVCQVKFAI